MKLAAPFALAAAAAVALMATCAAAAPPACPVQAAFTRPKRRMQAKAGGWVAVTLTLVNTGATSISALNVELGLPDNVCVTKGALHRPHGAKQAQKAGQRWSAAEKRPVVVDQKAQWFNVPVEAHGALAFKFKARISPLHPTATVPISALAYVLNATTGGVECASAATPAQLSIKALPASKAARKKGITCVAPPTPFTPVAEGERCQEGQLVNLTGPVRALEGTWPRRTLQTLPTAERCYQRCVEVGYTPIFHFSAAAAGLCWCCGATCTLVPDPNAVVRACTHACGCAGVWACVRVVNARMSVFFLCPSVQGSSVHPSSGFLRRTLFNP